MHPRSDTRIFRKECTSLAHHYGNVTLFVGDGRGDAVDATTGLKIIDIGAPLWRGRGGRIPWQALRMLRTVWLARPDVVHFHDPELIPLGLAMRLRGVRVVYDVHEDLPKQILSKHWISPWLRRPLAYVVRLFENTACRTFSALVTATPAITDRFKRLHPATVTVNNYPIEDELVDSGLGSRERRHVCYVGGITRVRGLSVILDALWQVPGLRLSLCGPFESAAYEAELRRHPGWGQVDYLGVVDRSVMREVLASSFAGLVLFLPEPNHVDAQPNKIFEYMSAGIPVIGSDFPLWRQVIADRKVGVCVNPCDADAIASAMRSLRDSPETVAEMGARGARVVVEELNWSRESKVLIALYDSFEPGAHVVDASANG